MDWFEDAHHRAIEIADAWSPWLVGTAIVVALLLFFADDASAGSVLLLMVVPVTLWGAIRDGFVGVVFAVVLSLGKEVPSLVAEVAGRRSPALLLVRVPIYCACVLLTGPNPGLVFIVVAVVVDVSTINSRFATLINGVVLTSTSLLELVLVRSELGEKPALLWVFGLGAFGAAGIAGVGWVVSQRVEDSNG